MKIDGGSNSHVLTKRNQFIQFRSSNISIQQLSGHMTLTKGYGTAIARIPNTSFVIPLWPVFYMPDNPQNTLSPTAIKCYNAFRSVRVESLGWIKFTNAKGETVSVRPKSHQQDLQKLDYIDLEILTTVSADTHIKPKINSSLIKNKLPWTLIHRRCGHVSDRKQVRRRTLRD